MHVLGYSEPSPRKKLESKLLNLSFLSKILERAIEIMYRQ